MWTERDTYLEQVQEKRTGCAENDFVSGEASAARC